MKRSRGFRCARCSGEYYYLYYLFFASNTRVPMLIIELLSSLRDGRKGFFGSDFKARAQLKKIFLA